MTCLSIKRKILITLCWETPAAARSEFDKARFLLLETRAAFLMKFLLLFGVVFLIEKEEEDVEE